MVESSVCLVGNAQFGALRGLAARFGVDLVLLGRGLDIPGSFWGEPEAGLVGDKLFVRADTPVHSLLHELCHYVCMEKHRRTRLNTDAGGDYDEENAVCYLQILLADLCPGTDRERILQDMDAWGYSFRLGSAAEWFRSDAEDARNWLLDKGLVDIEEQPTWCLRH